MGYLCWLKTSSPSDVTTDENGKPVIASPLLNWRLCIHQFSSDTTSPVNFIWDFKFPSTDNFIMIELQLLFVLVSELFGSITWFKLIGSPIECDIVRFGLFFLVRVSFSYLLNSSPLPKSEKSNMGGAMIRLFRGFVSSYIEAIIEEISSRKIRNIT